MNSRAKKLKAKQLKYQLNSCQRISQNVMISEKAFIRSTKTITISIVHSLKAMGLREGDEATMIRIQN